MKKALIAALALALTLTAADAQNRYSGYYKDIFMDGGVMLNAYPDLPAANFLNLSLEMFNSSENEDLNSRDTLIQTMMLCGSPIDENGILLYPDGQPRFRMIYTNGGKATAHGRSMTEKGRDNVRNFVANGGSFLGTCAGAYICSKGVQRDTGYEDIPEYYGIWPGYVRGTGLEKSFTSQFVEKKSPLLKYYDFGGDMVIDSVRHNGGCYAYVDADCPKNTEILLRYDGDTLNLKRSIHKKVSGWAYKASDATGRVVAIGSHPERMISGERLELMSSMIRYALDGNGGPKVKAALQNGVERKMTLSTSDNDPAFTRIGDRQYHHFTIDVPKGVKELKVNLNAPRGWNRFDLYLFARCGDFAYNDCSEWFNVDNGTDKQLTIANPKAGKLYISVFCATTVETEPAPYGQQYTGRTDVLNGVPYVISVKY